MFEEVLPKEAKTALAILGKSALFENAYLAGGTALALQLGHRVSVDFDFFTKEKFRSEMLVQELSVLPVKFRLDRLEWGTILGFLGRTRFSLFYYTYPLLAKPVRFSGIQLAGIKDIAPMKLAAISDRGARRDFIDLYFILAVEKLFSLQDILGFYDRKFKVLRQNKMHVLKSLLYFDEAEKVAMPNMLKEVRWTDVKTYFQNEVKKISVQV